MVGLAPSGPSLQDVNILDIGLIDHTNIPVDPWGLWMGLELVRYRGSQRHRSLLHSPSELCLELSPRGGSCEYP